jgi:hypothetical protein
VVLSLVFTHDANLVALGNQPLDDGLDPVREVGGGDADSDRLADAGGAPIELGPATLQDHAVLHAALGESLPNLSDELEDARVLIGVDLDLDVEPGAAGDGV